MQPITLQAFNIIGTTRTARRKLINRLIRAGIIDLDAIEAASLEISGESIYAPAPPKPRAQKRRLEFFVYVFRANGLCKIGRSVDPDWRAKQLQTGLPYPIETVHLIKTTEHGLERALHRRFHASKQRGEWYALTDADIQWIRDFGATLQH